MKQQLFTGLILVSLAFASCDGGNKTNGNSTTTSDSKEQLAKDEMYTCTMHNEVMGNKTGKCPKCDMTLVKQKMTDEQMKMMEEGTYTKPNE